MIRAQKSQKSISESQFFGGSMAGGLDSEKRSWIFRVKVLFIVLVFFACYKTFQAARDGLDASWGITRSRNETR